MIDRAVAVRIGKVLVGVGLLLLLVSRVAVTDIGSALLQADPLGCALGLAAFAVAQVMEIGRLCVAFRRYPLSAAGATHLHFTSLFFANFIPGSLGAEVYKVHVLRRLENDLARPIALLLLVRTSGLALLVAIVVGYLAVAYPRLETAVAMVLARSDLDYRLPMAVAGVLVLAAALMPVSSRGRRWLRRARPRLGTAWRAVRDLGTTALVALLVLGLMVWLCRAGALYWFVRAVDEQAPFLDVLLVVAFVNLVSLLPISFAALGVRESAIAVALVALGVSLSHALGVALISRAALWATSLAGGVLYLARGQMAGERLRA